MKFRITMDPDGPDMSINRETFGDRPGGLTDDEWAAVVARRKDKATEFCEKWLEYVELEFDTEAGTCVVVKT